MSLVNIYLIAGSAILGFMALLWLISLALRNSSIVDIFWGAGFFLAGWIYYALTPEGSPARKLLLMILVTIWGLRLSFHILFRNWRKPEDFRYQKWREEAGKSWWWHSFFKVFLLQGFFMWVISIPLLAAQYPSFPAALGFLDYSGAAVWAYGFFFEAVGDLQLSIFKSNPANKGKLLDRGVWRYTRHPNYFGDAAQWWGYFLIGLSAGGWWSIFSPAFMTFLLVKVSGVALLEKSLKNAKPGYQEYVRRTSAFIPLPPKK